MTLYLRDCVTLGGDGIIISYEVVDGTGGADEALTADEVVSEVDCKTSSEAK